MKWFLDMKIKAKLLISFILVALIAGVIGMMGVSNMRKISVADTNLYEHMTIPISDLTDTVEAFQKVRVNLRDAVLAGTPAEARTYADKATDETGVIDKATDDFQKRILSDKMKSAYEEFAATRVNFAKVRDQVLDLAIAGKDAEAIRALRAGVGAAQAEEAAIDKLQQMKVTDAKNTSDGNTQTANKAVSATYILLIVGMGLAICLGFFIAKIIGEPVRSVAAAAEKLAIGDVDVVVESNSKDEVGEMARAFGTVINTLRSLIESDGGAALKAASDKDLTARVKGSYEGAYDKMKQNINALLQNLDEGLGQVAIASEQVASASNQIGSGSQALAQGASEQASSLEEISSSLQEMASMTQQNAGNTKEARGLAEGARVAADKGVESMKQMSEAIDKIKKSSDDTAKILKTIDEIAFQTNLLALNAAVEAARAGDAGKGFAVVADEVRNLAMRSAEAAKNTANMIEESVKNAENGVVINQEVLKNLEEINDQVNKVSEVMAEIAQASTQQTQGIEQINTAVSQMDQVTQQNAANSEESASAAEELSSQAEEMRSMVSAFKLSDTGNAPSRPRPSAVQSYVETQHAKPKKVAVGVGSRNGNGKKSASPSDVIPLDDGDTLADF